MTTSATDWSEYVRAALRVHGLALTDAQQAAVTEQFALLAAMAAQFTSEPLPADFEPAPVFRL